MNWKPIETAPKDGTPIILWAKNLLHGGYGRAGNYVIGRWMQHDIEWWHVDDGKFGPYPLRGPSPTYWMPCPDPPEAKEKGD